MNRFVLIIMLLLPMMAMAQGGARQFMYQTVVHDNSGRPVAERTVGVELKIRQGSETGIAVHTESFTVQTNAYGLATLIVGSQAPLPTIGWNDGPYFVECAVDPNGGSNYSVRDVERMHAVPFAQSALSADSLVGGALRNETDPIFNAWNKSYNDITNTPTNISTWVNDAGYITGYNEIQMLSRSNDTIFLTGGSFVKLPAGFDGDYNSLSNRPTGVSAFNNDAGYLTGVNEVQVLSIVGDTVFLTGGSYVVLPLTSESQSLANAVGFGHSASDHQLKDLTDPTEQQDAITLQYLDTLVRGYTRLDRGHHNVSIADECEKAYWNGLWYTSSGTYTHQYADDNGFFSVDTLHLTIRHGSHHTYSHTASNQYTWHNTTYYRTGTYMHCYTAANGCPSIDTLRLTIQTDTTGGPCIRYRQAADTATVEACGSFEWHGQHIVMSGAYQQIFHRRYGQRCDSIAVVNVVIFPSFRIDTAVRSDSPIVWRGQSYSSQGDYCDTLTDVNGCDSIYVLHLMMHGTGGVGALPGLFSVAPGLKVRFSQGNLLYQSANNRWLFPDNQYDQFNDYCVGPYYRPYVDLFPWATSGYHNASDVNNIFYHPWSNRSVTSATDSSLYNNNRYGFGPSLNMPFHDLTDSSRNYDWGQYNPIVNGGNGSGQWRTLSADEWHHLVYNRPNASTLRSRARVPYRQYTTSYGYTYYDYREGYIILPDTWQQPSGVTFIPDTTSYTNQYNPNQWKAMEAAGAVFLPQGFYWSTTAGDGGTAWCLNANVQQPIIAPYNRSNGYHVRLVQYAAGSESPCRCSHYDTVIISNGPFSWHGKTYPVEGDYLDTLVNADGCDSLIFFSLIILGNGELPQGFSVAPGHQILFSKGNLQYHSRRNIWRFAPLQYDHFGTFNRYISDTNNCWIDLFGWGTSGYHDPTDNLNINYMPWSSGYNNYGPSSNMSEQSLVNESAQYDWGVHNPIANGGNQAGLWRTLTSDEWNYLLFSRPMANSLRRVCTVNGVFGKLLLPDNWTPPAGFVFNAQDVYEGNDWDLLEASGAVFLPAGGCRYQRDVSYAGEHYYYWSSTAIPYSSSARCYQYYLYGSNYDRIYYSDRYYGYSVRLVKDL